ncbi:MAG: citrulline utilization hydrolase CtlX [Spirosomataceae bacterium]
MSSQTTSIILMIRPVAFGFNPQTAGSNAFQDAGFGLATQHEAQTIALKEFDTMVAGLRASGVIVIVVEDTPEPHTPDSIFPNNWISFHDDGSVVLYPMQAPNRRLERRLEILDSLEEDFEITQEIDLSSFEEIEQYLEGTGSMVLDRVHRKAYACLSPRTHQAVLNQFAEVMDYEIVAFESVDGDGKQIYHTNVVMCIGEKFAVICLDTILDTTIRASVEASLVAIGKEVIPISLAQMNQFAGNMLEVKNDKDEALLVMSSCAYNSLLPEQLEALSRYCSIQHFDLSMIEGNGGGSARCMMAEVHLPLREL